jgi:hypothetical protein
MVGGWRRVGPKEWLADQGKGEQAEAGSGSAWRQRWSRALPCRDRVTVWKRVIGHGSKPQNPSATPLYRGHASTLRCTRVATWRRCHHHASTLARTTCSPQWVRGTLSFLPAEYRRASRCLAQLTGVTQLLAALGTHCD